MKKILLFTSFIFFTASTVLFAQHPTNLQSTNITSSSADLTWDGAACIAGGNDVKFRYREFGTSPWLPNGNPGIITTSPHPLIGLTAGTIYEWTVKCTGTTGWATPVQFMTSPFPVSYDCINSSCLDPLDGTGAYSVANGNANPLTDCQTSCVSLPVSYNCINGSCIDPLDGTGTYSVANGYANPLTDCQTSCDMPTIDDVIITDSIECFDSLATIQVNIIQATPSVSWKPILGYYLFGNFVPFASVPQGGNLGYQIDAIPNINNLIGVPTGTNWVVRIVDSIPFYTANPGGSGTSTTGVYDEYTPLVIPGPDQLSASNTNIQSSTNLCFGDCDDQERIVISGGTPPYNYTLDANPTVILAATETIDTLKNLCAGNYTLLVSDDNGCLTVPSPNTVVITEPSALVPVGDPYLYDQNSLHISCIGANDGFMVNLNLTTGGTGPYTFAADSLTGIFGDENSVDSLSPGIHIIYVQDSNGCLDSLENVTINEPALLELSLLSTTPASCFGVADGVISLDVTGGAGNNSYSLTGNSFPIPNSPISALLGDSIYEVFVQDGNGCIDSIHVPLSQPTEIVYSTTLSDYNGFEISCENANDGEVHFGNIGGGSGSYLYSCVPTGNTANYGPDPIFLGLAAGWYDLSVQDGNGCSTDTTVQLSDPGTFTIIAAFDTTYNGAEISCKDSCDGEITVTPTNGVLIVNYEFNNAGGFNTTNIWDSLCAASYDINAVDDNGCTANTTITVNEPSAISTVSSSTDEFCNGVDGTASLTLPVGGTGQYSYLWNGPNGYTSTTQNITGLEADPADYVCTITDDNGCYTIVSATVSEDNPFALTLTSTPTCPDINTGIAQVIVTPIGSNTLGTITYLWDDDLTSPQTTATANSLPIGLYTVDVTVYPGNFQAICVISDTISIDTTANAVSIASIDISDISCHDADDGEIIIHATGGTSPYEYQLNNGGFLIHDSIHGGPTPNGLTEGVYSIDVRDISGCITSAVINITNPPSLYIDTTMVNPIQCNGESNASIQAIIAVGGTPPYAYSVNGGFSHTNMSYFINYGAGTYTVEVQDANNCFSQDIVVIQEPPILVDVITPSLWNNYQVRCFGDTTAYANIQTTGGVSPYYNICIDELGDTVYQGGLSTVSYLSQGTYDFYTIDALGCVYSESITYHEPPVIEHHFIPTHVTCDGWNNGSLIDSVYGGVGGSINAYTYLWDTGETTYAIDSIPIGDYIITVTDMNNCISTDTFSAIHDNNALAASIDASLTTDVSCFNEDDGIITVAVSGGIPNINSFGDSIYYYLWDDTLFQFSNPAVGLTVNSVTNSATYSCVITDLQGCSTTVSHTITQPDEIEVDASITNEILCFGDDNGKLTVSSDGGTGPGTHTYYWSNNAPVYVANPDNNNVSAGHYIVTVQDLNGCFGSDSITLTEPDEMTLVISNTNISCFGFGDGTILADADGGTPFLGIPPEYEYSFYNQSGTQIDIETGATSQAEELTPGIYTVIATDDNGCTVESGTIYISQPGDSLSMSFSTQDATCAQNNGQASVFVFGGTAPYEYNWDNGQTGPNMIGLASGYYPIWIVDDNDCIIRDSAFVIGVQNVFLPNNLSAIEHTICLGDSVYLDIDERPGTTYQWENGSTIADRWVYPNKRENIYILTIFDVGCSDAYSVYATIHVDFVDASPASMPGIEYGDYPVIVKGDQVQVFSNNDYCDSYTWSWGENIVSSQSITDNPDVSTWYYINIDSADCSGYDSIYVVVGVLPYEAITPNGDNYNDTWTPLDIESYPEAIVQVFNRWGAIVFESTGGADFQAWDGTNKGEELPVGTYYYIIDLKTEDEPQTGPITIIR